MKKVFILLFFITLTLSAQGKVLYTVDFSKQKDGDAVPWLTSQGFEFLLDMKAFSMKFSNGALVIETTERQTGLMGIKFPEGNYLKNIGSVVIEWGVDRFPKGADWTNNNNRLAIGTIFGLGTKTFSSGRPLLAKPAPYFLGPFIGQREKVGKRYLGMLYKDSGRYYCVSNKSGTTVKTHFDINQKFQEEFKKKTPPLTAFGIQMNTKNTQGGAKAFIKSITFYSVK
jgi:hypothetical protein